MNEIIAPGIQRATTDKIGLIDADYIKYHVLSKSNPDMTGDEIDKLTQSSINQLEDLFNAKALLYCFTGSHKHNFRTVIALSKAYKGKRDVGDHRSNLVKAFVVNYIKERYPTIVYPDLEADDLLSMLQDKKTFIYSDDKDLNQVPGTHWNIKQGGFYEVEPKDAFMFLMEQMIIGDTVDNVGGLKGYGSIASDKLLTNRLLEDIPFAILHEYIKVHESVTIGIDEFVENWILLKTRINRGAYFKEKYKHAFNTLNLLKE